MPLIETDTGEIFADHFPHRVYTASLWSEAWEEVPHLYANRAYQGSGGDMSSAELVWRFGEGLQPGEMAFEQFDRKNLLDKYVRIEIDQAAGEDPILWHGYITDQATDRLGAFLRDAGRVLTGVQAFLAVGMEGQLAQTVIDTCWIQDGDGEYEIRECLTFNTENHFGGVDVVGNRSATKGPRGAYLFTQDLLLAERWTTRDILEYLFEYHSPKSIDGTSHITWKVKPEALLRLPDWDQSVVPADGRSLLSVLCQLCDRRRLMSWSVTVNDSCECEIDVFSFNSEDIVLPSGKLQQANTNTTSLDFDRAVDVLQADLRDSAAHNVEQVRVIGARKRLIATYSAQDDTLEADWNVADQTAFGAGPSGIAALDVDLQEWRVKMFRAAARFERVYSWFRLTSGWDGRVGDGVGGAKQKAFPDDDDYGEELYYLPALRFSSTIPRDFYRSAPDASPGEDLRPIVMLKTAYPTEEGAAPARYLDVEHFGRQDSLERTGDDAEGGIAWSASVAVQRHQPGIILRISGNQYAIAKNTFTPLADIDDAPDVDWRDNLVATLCMELHGKVEARWPSNDDLESETLDVARVMTIDLGEAARLDYIAPGTVQRQVDGALEYHPDAGDYLRDDREMMRDLARFVHEWYGTPRQAFSFAFRQISSILSVGQIITTIGSAETEEDVNSTVTGVEWDLLHGGTRVTTGFAEIDPVQLASPQYGRSPDGGFPISAADERFLRAAAGT